MTNRDDSSDELDDDSDSLCEDKIEDFQSDVVDENADAMVEYDEVSADKLMHEKRISSIREDYGLETNVFRYVDWEEMKKREETLIRKKKGDYYRNKGKHELLYTRMAEALELYISRKNLQ